VQEGIKKDTRHGFVRKRGRVMQHILKETVLQELDNRQSAGNHVDSRLFTAIEKAISLYTFPLRDKISFLSLIWHARDDSRLLTPKGSPRTLHDVAERMIVNNWTFDKLSSNLGVSADQHNPEWFKKCLPINENFDYAIFGRIALVQANDNERKQSPSGSFYIYDGAHKSLVLSKLLLANEFEFKPIEALLILPRPDD
jgi:hypothetical protein